MFSTARSSRAASVSNEVETRANQQEHRGGTNSRTQEGSHSMVDIMVFGGVVNLSGNMYQATPTAPGSSRRNRAMPAEYPRVGRSRQFVNGGPMRSVNRNIFRRDSIRTSNAFTRQPSRHRSSRASRRFDRNSSLQNVEYRQVVESWRFNGTQNTPNVPHMAPITPKTPHRQQHLLPLVPPGSGGVASGSRSHVEQVEQDASRRADAGRGSVGIQGPLNLDNNNFGLPPNLIAPGSSRRNSAMPAEQRVNESRRINELQNIPSVAPAAPFNPRTSPPFFVFPPANTGIGGTASESGHHVEQDATSRSDAGRNSVRNQGPLNPDDVDFGLAPISIDRYEVINQKFHFVVVNTSCDSIEDENEATDLASHLGVTVRSKRLVDMPIGNKKMLIVEADKKEKNRLRNRFNHGNSWATFWCKEALLREEPFLWSYLSEVDLMEWIMVTNWYKHNEPSATFFDLKTKKDRHSMLEDCFKDPLTFIPLWESLNNHGKRMARNVASSVGIDIEDVIN